MQSNRCSMFLIASVFIAGSSLGGSQGVGGNRDDLAQWTQWLLFPEQDEASVERKIAEYLKEKDGANATLVNTADNAVDLRCVYTLAPSTGPGLKLVVDTHIAARDNQTQRVTARCIELSGYYRLPDAAKTPALRGKLLELMNAWHQTHLTPSHICLDKDGDLQLTTHIIIPAPGIPIHAEMVRDSVQRMGSVWSDFYEQMTRTIDLPTTHVGTSPRSAAPQPQPSGLPDPLSAARRRARIGQIDVEIQSLQRKIRDSENTLSLLKEGAEKRSPSVSNLSAQQSTVRLLESLRDRVRQLETQRRAVLEARP